MTLPFGREDKAKPTTITNEEAAIQMWATCAPELHKILEIQRAHGREMGLMHMYIIMQHDLEEMYCKIKRLVLSQVENNAGIYKMVEQHKQMRAQETPKPSTNQQVKDELKSLQLNLATWC